MKAEDKYDIKIQFPYLVNVHDSKAVELELFRSSVHKKC